MSSDENWTPFAEPEWIEVEAELNQPMDSVWKVLIDVDTHPHWLDPHSRTVYEAVGEVGKGTWFERLHVSSNKKTRAQIVAFEPPRLLAVRAQTEEGAIIETEYQLEPLPLGCRLHVFWRCDPRYSFGEGKPSGPVLIKTWGRTPFYGPIIATSPSTFPADAIRKHWSECLQRLQAYCSRSSDSGNSK